MAASIGQYGLASDSWPTHVYIVTDCPGYLKQIAIYLMEYSKLPTAPLLYS